MIMNIDELKRYCAVKNESQETYPFGPDTIVFKVSGKIYALVGLDEQPLRINLKCDPSQAQILRSMHDNILPGYHMNKEHWNTIIIDETIPDELICQLIDESYNLIVQKMTRKKQNAIKGK